MKQYIIYGAIVCLTTLVVVSILLYGNFSFIKIASLFEKPKTYENEVVLFYGLGCDQCTKVDIYIASNNIEAKVPFVNLEVFDNLTNEKILLAKAQVCGIDVKHIGVPFLWDGPHKRCVMGYLDVISFFKDESTSVKK